ncbi:hypothetical protein [Treponema saccharophilum]|uniref:Uncharacterized protein n=1 Tax=Treponema saccharophilum DSM 2985 TaxID=907348 RepID=H7EJK6_9SPIR|nr:hypothetical protein [Treponema saccharophilum]EIC02244.1 hypothetical protein TresaDRAFT_1508 [Treponema saccharophilum DSM 2985]BDC97288.1 hypothetical protein TRSA_23870 [Treponema saccharophilum]
MSVIEIISVATAVLSLGISFFLVFRDKKQSRLDLLMSFYDRLQSANAELQLAKETELAQKLQMKVDGELETACFMLYKKKLDADLFYHLYAKWLQAREREIAQSKDLYKYLGKSYTIWAIKKGNEKGYFVPDNKFGSEMSNYAMALSSKNGQVEVK